MSTSFSKSPYAQTTYSGADMLVTLSIKNTSQHKNVTQVLGELQTLSYSTHMDRSGVRKLGNINVADFTNGPRTIAGSLVFAVFERHLIRPIIDQMGANQELLPDELPPFDITITYANEYGKDSVLRIYGVRLVNEGQVCSVNDIYMENTYQYVASNIQPLEKTDLSLQVPTTDSGTETDGEESTQELGDLLNLDILDLPDDSTPQLIIRQLDTQINFDVNVKTESLTLIIVGEDEESEQKSYSLKISDWPLKLKLKAGNYKAILQNQFEAIYYTTSFSVTDAKPTSPLITKVSTSVIAGKTYSDTYGVTITDNQMYSAYANTSEIKTFEFKNLKANTEYYLQSENKFGTCGNLIKQKTLGEYADNTTEFESFLKDNDLMGEGFEDVMIAVKKIRNAERELSLLEACYKAYQAYIDKGKKVPEAFIHYASYFDLVMQQKKLHFVFKNKWLSQIEPHFLATNYKVRDKNGTTVNPQQTSDLTSYQQLYNATLEKLVTYKPSPEYQQILQQFYLAKLDSHNKLKQVFNTRHSSLPINQTYGFYDEMLSSQGAYINIANDGLEACLELTPFDFNDVYFVFKEDICTDASFKVKATNHPLKLDNLSFFNADSVYVVYLESKSKAISKSILISNGKCEYLYDTLLSLCSEYKLKDIVLEICSQHYNAFEAFCYGMYLLISRKKLSAYYIKMFDDWLFNNSKLSPIAYYKQSNMIHLAQEVTMIIFDGYGNLSSSFVGDCFNAPTTGYLVWFAPNHQMGILNFENI